MSDNLLSLFNSAVKHSSYYGQAQAAVQAYGYAEQDIPFLERQKRCGTSHLPEPERDAQKQLYQDLRAATPEAFRANLDDLVCASYVLRRDPDLEQYRASNPLHLLKIQFAADWHANATDEQKLQAINAQSVFDGWQKNVPHLIDNKLNRLIKSATQDAAQASIASQQPA